MDKTMQLLMEKMFHKMYDNIQILNVAIAKITWNNNLYPCGDEINILREQSKELNEIVKNIIDSSDYTQHCKKIGLIETNETLKIKPVWTGIATINTINTIETCKMPEIEQ